MGEERSGAGRVHEEETYVITPRSQDLQGVGLTDKGLDLCSDQVHVMPPPSWDCTGVLRGLSFLDLWPLGGEVQESDRYLGLGRRQHVGSILNVQVEVAL